MIYDALIIGGGPAGLTVALTLARQLHTSVVFDSQEYRNTRSRNVHMVLSWDHKDPADFRDAALENIQQGYDTVQIEKSKIAEVRKDPKELFSATDASGREWHGRKLVFACGIRDIYPAIQGYDECWAYGIFHCLFCHGYEERHEASAGVLATDDIGAVPPALHLARNVLQLVPKATIYTSGSKELAQSLQDAINDSKSEKPPQMVVDSRKIVRMQRGAKESQVILHFEDDSKVTEAFLAHKPKSESSAAALAKQLGLEMTPQGDIKADPPFYQGSEKGVFVAGDTNPTMKFVNSSMFTGCAVGSGLAAQLQAERWGQKSMI